MTIYSYEGENKELELHTSTWINLKNIKLNGGGQGKQGGQETNNSSISFTESPSNTNLGIILLRKTYVIKALMKIKGINTKLVSALEGKKAGHTWRKAQ